MSTPYHKNPGPRGHEIYNFISRLFIGHHGIKSTRNLTDSYPGQPVPGKSTRNHIREVNS